MGSKGQDILFSTSDEHHVAVFLQLFPSKHIWRWQVAAIQKSVFCLRTIYFDALHVVEEIAVGWDGLGTKYVETLAVGFIESHAS